MKKGIAIAILIFTSTLNASEWPAELVQKTYQGCTKKGGAAQCECLVLRLQNKFTFEDMQLTRTSRIAFEALRQAVEAYNVKCLDADFKRETLMLKHQK